MGILRQRAFLFLLTLVAGRGAVIAAQDRIYIDQHSALRSELIIADADGKNPRKLVPGSQLDYNASFSPDGQWIVFTSERHGSADIFRTRLDGMGVERLTNSPAYDDQASLSPDNRFVAFVSTQNHGSTDIYILDFASRTVRNLTNSPGGDFRPSWSPDGQMIAFSSDRGTGFPHVPGSWEHSHATSIYTIRTDGTELRRLTANPEMAAGSPKWSADGKQIVFYEVPVRDTLAVRARDPRGSSEIVSIDLATEARTVRIPGPSLNLSPQFVGSDNQVAYLARTGLAAALAFSTGEKSASEDISNPAWSHDGKQVVYHAGQLATMHHYSRTPGAKLHGKDVRFDLAYGSAFPAISPDGKSIVISDRASNAAALVVWDTDGTNPRRIYQDENTVAGLEWSRDGKWIAFGAGNFFGQRTSRPAQVMIIKPDGSELRAVTSGPGNAGFPSWSPDGTQMVYRFWTEAGAGGLRIVNVATGAVRTLTTDYDGFPVWSPNGDRIVFNRYARDSRFPYEDFDIYSMRPDGSDIQRLTDSEGNDAHPYWSPDGRYILWTSSRFGFKDEASLSIIQPQPYGELFIMNADGSDQRPLTDNQYEDATPAWLPEHLAVRTEN